MKTRALVPEDLDRDGDLERRAWGRAMAALVIANRDLVEPSAVLKQTWPDDPRAAARLKAATSPTSTANAPALLLDIVQAYRSLAPSSAALQLFEKGVTVDLRGLNSISLPSLANVPAVGVFVPEGGAGPNLQFDFGSGAAVGPVRKVLLMAAANGELENAVPGTHECRAGKNLRRCRVAWHRSLKPHARAHLRIGKALTPPQRFIRSHLGASNRDMTLVSNQPSPNRRKGRLLCGAKTRAGGCCQVRATLTKIGYPSRYRHFRWFSLVLGIFNNRDAAMWSVRSVGDRVVPTFFCIIFTLIAGGAQAQKATDASDSKRVQVLQVKEGAAAKEIAVKKPKSAATHAKKKAAHRNNLSQTQAATNEAPKPAQDDISTPAAEQTGTLGVSDRVVAFASSPGDNNDVGLSVANQAGAIGEPASALAVVNPPRANVDAEQSSTNQMLGAQVGRVPSVTGLGNVERGNGGGRVRLVPCQFKPKAHFGKHRHVAFIACTCHSAAFHFNQRGR